MQDSCQRTYHGCGAGGGSHRISIYTHEGIKGDRIKCSGNVTGHTKEQCNEHSKAEGPVQHRGNAHT